MDNLDGRKNAASVNKILNHLKDFPQHFELVLASAERTAETRNNAAKYLIAHFAELDVAAIKKLEPTAKLPLTNAEAAVLEWRKSSFNKP